MYVAWALWLALGSLGCEARTAPAECEPPLGEKPTTETGVDALPNAPPSGTAPTAAVDAREGFGSEPIRWRVPDGEAPTDFASTQGSSWVIADMDGDGRVDLLSHGRLSQLGAGGVVLPFGEDGDYHVRVYRNTGGGFDTAPVQWPLPPLVGSELPVREVTSDTCSYFDIDGDRRPDFVAFGSPRYDQGIRSTVPWSDGERVHWKVYRNRGDRFDAREERWTLPQAAEPHLSSVTFDEWDNVDMDGDLRADLVWRGSRSAGGSTPFEDARGRFWRIFRNTGSGFSNEAERWPLPDELDMTQAVYGANLVLRDVDGDTRPDLVYSAQWSGTDVMGRPRLEVFGRRVSPTWRVYPNTGAGFSSQAIEWRVPLGPEPSGYATTSSELLVATISNSAMADSVPPVLPPAAWYLLDMNGDARPELVDLGAWSPNSALLAPWLDEQRRAAWKVFANEGAGFGASPTHWRIPDHALVSGSAWVAGQQTFAFEDMDGDGDLDMLFTGVWGATREGAEVVPRVDDRGPYWLVYPNQTTP